jgi:hypothetical protein
VAGGWDSQPKCRKHFHWSRARLEKGFLVVPQYQWNSVVETRIDTAVQRLPCSKLGEDCLM